MQRIMGLVGEHKVPPLRGNLSGNLGEFGSKVPKQGEKLLLSSSGYRSEGVNRARSGGIDQGKPVFGTFKGERDEAKVMGNPSKNPYSKSDSISYMVCDLPPGGRDQNVFSPFWLFRGNGSWCRISRVQSPSHHIISEPKNSPLQAICGRVRNIFRL